MGKQCTDILDIVPETVVLAFDVTGWRDPKDARRIAEAKAVSEAIAKELNAQGKKLIDKHFSGKQVSQEDALTFLGGAGSKLLDNRKKEMEKRLKCAYSESPLGVWLDRNSWVLYVFAPLLVGSAGTWMYSARTGDTPASWASSMANVKKKWDINHVGKITLGTSDVTFVPSKREISAKAFTMLEWEPLSIRLEIGAGSKEDKFTGVDSKIDASYALRKDLKLTLDTGVSGAGNKASGDPWTGKTSLKLGFSGAGASSNFSLSLGGQLEYDRFGLRKAGASTEAAYTTKLGQHVPLSIGVKAEANQFIRPNDPLVNPDAAPAHSFGVTAVLRASF